MTMLPGPFFQNLEDNFAQEMCFISLESRSKHEFKHNVPLKSSL